MRTFPQVCTPAQCSRQHVVHGSLWVARAAWWVTLRWSLYRAETAHSGRWLSVLGETYLGIRKRKSNLRGGAWGPLQCWGWDPKPGDYETSMRYCTPPSTFPGDSLMWLCSRLELAVTPNSRSPVYAHTAAQFLQCGGLSILTVGLHSQPRLF